MRIITGDFKGRKIEMPAGYDIRPTTEKVKEAMFSIIGQDIYDAVCVDLFSGTGNLGLEALSRGAEKCWFCDNNRESIRLIKQNIANCRAEEWSCLVPGDYEKCLMRIKESGDKVDVFLLDPPYKKGLYGRCFELIKELDILAEDGIIVAEHKREDEFPEEFEGFTKLKDRNYGTITLSVYCNLYKNV